MNFSSKLCVYCKTFSSAHQLWTKRRITTRLPTNDMFSANQFCWRSLSKRTKRFSFKKYSFFIKFCNFSTFKNFRTFGRKKLTIKVEKTFSRNNTIWCAFDSKFATFPDVDKNVFLQKQPNFFFSKKIQFSFVFEKSDCFNRILR